MLGLAVSPWAAAVGEEKSDSVGQTKPVHGGRSKHYWIDVLNLGAGGDFGVAGVQFNFAAKDKQWMASYRVLEQDFIFNHRVERSSGNAIKGQIHEFGISRVWHRPSRGGYVNASVGLSVLRGDVGSDCEQTHRNSGFILGARYECRREQFSTLGLPLRLSAGGGRYVGIAMHLDLNLNLEEPFVLLSLSMPIGTFAR